MEQSVTIGEHRLHVVRRGSGPSLLLVHGFPLDHRMWTGQLDGLDADYDLIAPDLRGFGASTAVNAELLSMAELADDLAGLLDALLVTEPVIFCGLSMGGYVGWEFFRRHASRLAGMILCDTRAAADSPEVARARQLAAERAMREGTAALCDEMLPRLFATPRSASDVEPVGPRPDPARALIAQLMAETPAATFAAAQRGMAGRTSGESLLGQVHLPVLLICGEQDVITPPSEMRGLAEQLPDAELIEVPAAGHLAPLEQPDRVNAAMRAFRTRLAT